MNRIIRMRRYNPSSESKVPFDILFPQTVTANVLRREDGGVLEDQLLQYDRHLQNSNVHMNGALSGGTARALSARIDGLALVDGLNLLLTLHTDLEAEPTLSYNGSDPYPIVNTSGTRIPGGQAEGCIIFLVWSEARQQWILLGSDDNSDITKVVLPVENEYVYTALEDGETIIVVPGFDKRYDRLAVNYGQTILRRGIDYDYVESSNTAIYLIGFGLPRGDQLFFTVTSFTTTAKRGNYKYDLITKDYTVTITEDDTTVVRMPHEAISAHKVEVNYNQTILRNGLDYTRDLVNNTIVLTEIKLPRGDKIVFTVTEFQEANGELTPNNFGATGNYRYSLNVIHEEYTASEDNITVIPVPNFNPRRDEVSVIRNNQLYVFDVDYTIDEIGNVVLLKTHLDANEKIFFTILQGAMMDVPNFNVIDASGESGQHILLNISHSQLCNFYTLLVRLKFDLIANPTLKCVDGPALPIYDVLGQKLKGGNKAGSFLWVAYNEEVDAWYTFTPDTIPVSPVERVSASGTDNFIGQPDVAVPDTVSEVAIPHGLGVMPSRIEVHPSGPPDWDAETGAYTSIGDVWYYADATYIYVGNSGKSLSRFSWYAEV